MPQAGSAPGSFKTFALLAAVLFGLQAAVLFGVRGGEAHNRVSAAELAPSVELFGDRTLLQTFVNNAEGLTTIVLYPIPREAPTKGRVELRLETWRGTAVERATVAATDFLARPEWTWTFPPVQGSSGQRYGVRVGAPDAIEGNGLSLAIGPPSYVDGIMYVGPRDQWGDLRFETRAEYGRLVDLLRHRPAVQRGAWVPIAACGVMLLLATSLSALVLSLIRDREAA